MDCGSSQPAGGGSYLSLSVLQQYLHLRIAILALAEKASPPWWRSQAWSAIAKRLLQEQLFPRTYVGAALRSTAMVARLNHDASLGPLGAYHLFRLPADLETQVADSKSLDEETMALAVSAMDGSANLLEVLRGIAGAVHTSTAVGPIRCGTESDLRTPKAPGAMASCYATAFEEGSSVVPYFDWERA